ncbi:MAG: GntR family transcriptional regulator [Burkholderiaceae bacterium]|jgi:GntR family transcriptional regulator|nr:GntR family transcriptional regulator [Burkholderiaceae bacterium]
MQEAQTTGTALLRTAMGPLAEVQLDPHLPSPLWRQLLSHITQVLASGALKPGDSLPAERDLATALNISRVTVKHCYDELRRAGRLAGRGRAGSVIQAATQPARPAMERMKSFTEEMQELGKTASSQLLAREVVHDRAIASIFGLPSGAPFLHLRRIRMGDGVPIMRELAWYDLSVVPAMNGWDCQGSAYQWLRENCGIKLTSAEQVVEAILCSRDEMTAFDLHAPIACLLFKRKTSDANGHLIEYVESTYRGDAYVYRTHLAG